MADKSWLELDTSAFWNEIEPFLALGYNAQETGTENLSPSMPYTEAPPHISAQSFGLPIPDFGRHAAASQASSGPRGRSNGPELGQPFPRTPDTTPGVVSMAVTRYVEINSGR
jgi:hypothetical protein